MKRPTSLSATEIKKLVVQNLKIQLEAQGYDVYPQASGSRADGTTSYVVISIGGVQHKITVETDGMNPAQEEDFKGGAV